MPKRSYKPEEIVAMYYSPLSAPGRYFVALHSRCAMVAHSGPLRPLIPIDCDWAFRLIATTHSGDCDQAVEERF